MAARTPARRRALARRVLPRLIGLAALAPAARANPRPWEPIPASAWTEPARPDSGGSEAITLLSRGEVIDRNEECDVRILRRILVLTAEGASAGRVEIVVPEKSVVSDIAGRAVFRDGRTVELRADQIFTSVLWKTGRTRWDRTTFLVPGIEPGCIVEYQYAIREPSYWSDPWYLQDESYTCRSELVWHPSEWVPAAQKPRWTLQRIPEFQVAVQTLPDDQLPREVRFTALAQPGVKGEPLAPPLSDAAARVLVGYGDLRYDLYWSWWKHQIEDFVTELQKDTGPLDGMVQAALKRTGDPDRALHEIHDWLRANLATVDEASSDELQRGARAKSEFDQSPSIADLFRRGHGIPFEINVAYMTAAKQLGMSAHLVLVRDRREGAFTPEVKGWAPGWVVTAVQHPDGRVRYHQPASRFALYGSIPSSLRGGSGLRLGDDQRLFEALPAQDDRGAEERSTVRLKLDAAGNASGELTTRLEGESARRLRAALWRENPSRWAVRMAEQTPAPSGTTIEYAPVAIDQPPDSALVLRAHVTISGAGAAAGRSLALTLDRLLPWRFHARLREERRRMGFYFEYPRREIDDVWIELPPGAALDGEVPPQHYEGALGSWDVTAEAAPGGLHVSRRIELLESDLTARLEPSVREYLNGLDDRDHLPMLVKLP